MRLSKERIFPLTFALLAAAVLIVHPNIAYADFEGSLRNVKSELSAVVLPLLSVIGLLISSFSYMTGHPDAKRHVTYALIGAALGFGSQAVIDFIGSMVH